jgi:hypothetical protein
VKETDMGNALHEQRKLAGLAPRYRDWSLSEQVVDDPPEDQADMDAGPPQEEPPAEADDEAQPPADEEDGDKGALAHWEEYRKMEAKALKLAQDCIEMYETLSVMTEDEMTREQRRSLKTAKLAMREAVAAQKAAFRKISEFGSTMLGK